MQTIEVVNFFSSNHISVKARNKGCLLLYVNRAWLFNRAVSNLISILLHIFVNHGPRMYPDQNLLSYLQVHSERVVKTCVRIIRWFQFGLLSHAFRESWGH